MQRKQKNKKKEHNRIKLVSLAACAILAFGAAGISIYGRKSNSGTGLVTEVTFPKAYAYDDYETRAAVREANPLEEEFLTAIKEFAWQTSSELITDKSVNANYSPLSLYYALSLAAAGAEGDTAEELFALLGAESQEKLSQQCGNLYRRLYVDNKIGKLKIANSLWLSESVSFKNTFIENAAGNFYAPAYHVDFTSDDTAKAMADWIADNTNGTLKPVIQMDKDQLMSILNTIYFKAEWIDSFDEAKTKEDSFYLSDGSTVTCDYMNRTYGSAGFAKGDGFTSAGMELKQYGTMVFVLPDEGVSVWELLDSPEKLKEAFEGEQNGYGEVVWQIPKFGFSSEFELAEALKRLGVNSAFAKDADFSRITDETAFISSIRQETHIGIDEKGVEASAFTQIIYTGAGMPRDRADMILNRPFLYGIISNEGLPIFIGVCGNPAE